VRAAEPNSGEEDEVPWPFGTGARRREARIDAWLPRGAWKLERHSIEIDVEPGAALAPIGGVQLRDVPVVGALFMVRGIPYRADEPLARFFSTSPFLILEEEPGRELVFGVIGPFWQWRRGRVPPRIPGTPDEFRAAMAKGRIAAVGNFRAEPVAGGTRLWTETWAFAPRLSHAILFTVYWLLIGPFSAWIRRMLLRAGRRHARGATTSSEVRT
jgi:hypothetical protein